MCHVHHFMDAVAFVCIVVSYVMIFSQNRSLHCQPHASYLTVSSSHKHLRCLQMQLEHTTLLQLGSDLALLVVLTRLLTSIDCRAKGYAIADVPRA